MADPRQFAFTTQHPGLNLIDVISGSTEVTNSVGVHDFDIFDVNQNKEGDLIGVYSVDGGATWQDFQALAQLFGVNISGNSNLPAVLVELSYNDDTNAIDFNIDVLRTVGGGATFTLLYRIGVIWHDEISPAVVDIDPQFLEPQSLFSKRNYLKRFKRYPIPLPGSGGGAVDIEVNHGLGYPPMIRAIQWFESSNTYSVFAGSDLNEVFGSLSVDDDKVYIKDSGVSSDKLFLDVFYDD